MNYKVLITTSGLGTRLGDLTDYTNKSLVRIGRKPTLSYIIENYDKNTEFVVTVGYKSELVKDFLTLTYPNIKFTFVEIDKFQGEGSSLAYSISKTENFLQCPFVYHACDTIVFDKNINTEENWCGVYGKKDFDSSLYRTITVNNSEVSKINDKGYMNYDYIYMGISFIKDYEIFWNSMKKVLNDGGDLSDCNVINNMIQSCNFKYKVYDEWLDIGNTQSLLKAREMIHDKFHLLDKVDETIYLFEDFVIKFFSNDRIVENRINRTKVLGDVVPEILDNKKNFYKYKYVDGDLLSDVVNNEIFKHFLTWLKNNLWSKKPKNYTFYHTCHHFYFDKTKKRLTKLFKELNIEDKEDIINGVKVPSTSNLLKMIDEKWICDVDPYSYHGDLILDNVIYTKPDFKLLDWRQDFGGDIENGDIYYDLSKLNHNMVLNHDVINRKLYTINIKGDNIYCDILRCNKLCECQEILYKFINDNGFDIKKVKLLTSIIWLNMSPLHEYPLNKFLYYFGKYNLYKSIEQIHDK